MNIYPTGTCFEDATQLFLRLLKMDLSRRNNPDFVLVHAICLMPQSRQPFAHAWVRDGETVLFAGYTDAAQTEKVACGVPWEEFRANFQIQDFTEYNYTQAMAAALDSGDQPPPWELKYRMLCKDWNSQNARVTEEIGPKTTSPENQENGPRD